MSDREALKQSLLEELFKLPVHSITANKKEISIRCPYCGDSRKHNNSSHLYINIDPYSDKFLQCYCQRCKAKGYVNNETLKDLNIKNQQLVISIEEDNKENRRKNRVSYKKSLIKKNQFKFPEIKETKNNLIKLNYINKRLGTHLKLDELYKYKIILSLYDVLDENNVKYLNCKNEEMGDILDGNFMGFVSYDNNYIILRNLSKKVLPETRYFNYNIHNLYDNTKKFYIMPHKMNILTEQITVVITEGIFDILGVYFNIETEDRENKLFVAVCGIGYNAVLNEIIRMGYLNIHLKIYGDSDQDIRIYQSMEREFRPFITKIELFNNTMSKDFGDVRKGINIKKMNLNAETSFRRRTSKRR